MGKLGETMRSAAQSAAIFDEHQTASDTDEKHHRLRRDEKRRQDEGDTRKEGLKLMEGGIHDGT